MTTQHKDQRRIGVLIAQLGTPDTPTAKGLRPYLRQFLSDTRVIDYHPLIWQPLLRGLILVTRPRRSAKLYARIWTEEGSPLMVFSDQQVEGIQARLGDRYRVILGMTYGNPGIRQAMRTLENEGIDRIIVFPMFPQFSSTTTASIYDAVYTAAAGRRCPLFLERKRVVPTLRFIEPYYDHPGYISAMKARLEQSVAGMDAPPDKFIITYHGIPNRYVRTGDPYRDQCDQTTRLLVEAMGWNESDYIQCFQSRFGPEPWLQPYTDEVLEGLYEQGVRRPLVFSPGFTTDCLETLDELGNEGREQFEEGGGHGEEYHLAPCLNADPLWLDTIAELILQNAQGWVTAPATASQTPVTMG